MNFGGIGEFIRGIGVGLQARRVSEGLFVRALSKHRLVDLPKDFARNAFEAA